MAQELHRTGDLEPDWVEVSEAMWPSLRLLEDASRLDTGADIGADSSAAPLWVDGDLPATMLNRDMLQHVEQAALWHKLQHNEEVGLASQDAYTQVWEPFLSGNLREWLAQPLWTTECPPLAFPLARMAERLRRASHELDGMLPLAQSLCRQGSESAHMGTNLVSLARTVHDVDRAMEKVEHRPVHLCNRETLTLALGCSVPWPRMLTTAECEGIFEDIHGYKEWHKWSLSPHDNYVSKMHHCIHRMVNQFASNRDDMIKFRARTCTIFGDMNDDELQDLHVVYTRAHYALQQVYLRTKPPRPGKKGQCQKNTETCSDTWAEHFELHDFSDSAEESNASKISDSA